VSRTFDLAVSLEVGEHLPESAAKTFVESLTRLAPVVLFSAAIPGQGGTSHVNEQWPEYWSRLFANHGFDPADVVRPRIWGDERVEFWYAQNVILYAARSRRADFPELQRATMTETPLAAVHPRLIADRDRRLGEMAAAHADATAQLERQRHETAAARARAQASEQDAARLQAELAALHVDLERFRFMSEPRNMALRTYVRALPQVVRGALPRILRQLRPPWPRP